MLIEVICGQEIGGRLSIQKQKSKNPNKHYRYNLLGYTELILHISYPVYHPYKNGQFQPVEKDKERSIVEFVVVTTVKFNKR